MSDRFWWCIAFLPFEGLGLFLLVGWIGAMV